MSTGVPVSDQQPVNHSALPNDGTVCEPSLPHEQLLPAKHLHQLKQEWLKQQRREWQQLRLEAQQLAEQAHEQKTALLERETTIELERRRLETSWQQYHTEKKLWQSRVLEQEQHFAAQQQALEAQKKQIENAEHHWVAYGQTMDRRRAAQLQEMEGLEKRIENYRKLLSDLRDEVAQLEASKLKLLQSSEQTPLQEQPAVSIIPLLSVNDPVMLDGMERVVDDLFDEQQRLADYQDELLRLREAWLVEWERVEGQLANRETELEAQELAFETRQAQMQKLVESMQEQVELHEQQSRHQQAWEGRLALEQGQLHLKRQRLASMLRARALIVQEARRQLHLLETQKRVQWEEMAQKTEAAERHFVQLRTVLADRCAELDRREQHLDQREAELVARETILYQAEQQLIHRDPDPCAARSELDRRFAILDELIQRPLRTIERREHEWSRNKRELDRYQQRLKKLELAVQSEREAWQFDRNIWLKQREQQQADRIKFNQVVLRLKQERLHNQREIQELRQQLERLTMLLLEPLPKKSAVLALAA